MIVIVFQLYFFQKLWLFLVFRGISSDLNLEEKLIWVRKIGLKSQIGFYVLIICHILIQLFLFSVLQYIPEIVDFQELISLGNPFFVSILPFNLLVFFTTIIFEAGFFLLLIIFPVIQFQNQGFLFSSKTSYDLSIQHSILNILNLPENKSG